jgi:hypothetical protein
VHGLVPCPVNVSDPEPLRGPVIESASAGFSGRRESDTKLTNIYENLIIKIRLQLNNIINIWNYRINKPLYMRHT